MDIVLPEEFCQCANCGAEGTTPVVVLEACLCDKCAGGEEE